MQRKGVIIISLKLTIRHTYMETFFVILFFSLNTTSTLAFCIWACDGNILRNSRGQYQSVYITLAQYFVKENKRILTHTRANDCYLSYVSPLMKKILLLLLLHVSNHKNMSNLWTVVLNYFLPLVLLYIIYCVGLFVLPIQNLLLWPGIWSFCWYGTWEFITFSYIRYVW